MLLSLTEGLIVTNGFDGECAELADRHYSRRTRGARQFLYSGRKLVLRDAEARVVFGWIWPDESMRMDGQTGYNNAIFRNESSRRSSEIILEAERLAVAKWGPNRGYTYIDPRHVKSANPGARLSSPEKWGAYELHTSHIWNALRARGVVVLPVDPSEEVVAAALDVPCGYDNLERLGRYVAPRIMERALRAALAVLKGD